MAGCRPAFLRQERGSAGAPFFWLFLLLLGWATSVLVALTGNALFALPLAAYVCLRLGRRSLVLALAVALPLQGYAGVAADVRGPGHFHAHGPAGAHFHAHVEHHQHVASDDAVPVDDGAQQAASKAKRAVLSGDTMIASAVVEPGSPSLGVAERPAPPPDSHFPPAPERPPAFFS